VTGASSRWTWHGGGLSAAQAHYAPDASWLDLSTGINPHAWPHAESIRVDWRALPDEQALRDMAAAAALAFGCDPRHVCAVPGTEVGLRLVGDLLPGPAWHLAPTYRTHGEMVPTSCPIADEDLHRANGATLIVANPNNPTGRLTSRAGMMALEAGRGGEGWLVVDEAFADCHPEHSIAGEVNEDRRIVVFRSFGKFFGLAGLRLGFVIAPPCLAGQLRRRLGAWPVSAAAIAIGATAYRDLEWAGGMRASLFAEAAELDRQLQARGYEATGACPLFRLIRHDRAHALFEHLAERAILTRPFDGQASWLRIGLPAGPAELARLLEALPANG